MFAHVLTFLSILLVLVTLPVSLVWVVKVVQVSHSANEKHCCPPA